MVCVLVAANGQQTSGSEVGVLMDPAVTSGMRQGAAAASAASEARAAEDYEARKRAHLQTAAACADEGLQFVLLVADAAGGAGLKTWKQVAPWVAARPGAGTDTERITCCRLYRWPSKGKRMPERC